ncbi:hypothetical protein CEXT_710101 [Caerostris extrusa]|uniref:Maturase K n=1 Tax=Caerostris extrusa TaxID=172846 RepID=A0AAV4VVX8_CAEEX|nr:hypothetical protein CEXT_710101 [Caerostris extrusa]
MPFQSTGLAKQELDPFQNVAVEYLEEAFQSFLPYDIITWFYPLSSHVFLGKVRLHFLQPQIYRHLRSCSFFLFLRIELDPTSINTTKTKTRHDCLITQVVVLEFRLALKRLRFQRIFKRDKLLNTNYAELNLS